MNRNITKAFFTFLVALLICSNAVLAASKKEQQEAEEKIAQLKQLVIRASQGGEQAPKMDIKAGEDLFAQDQKSPVSNKPAAVPVMPTPPEKQPGNAVSNMATAKPDLYDQAFSNVINQVLPMSPKQTEMLQKVYLENQKVAATPPGIPPKPTSTSLMVSLSPGSAPPVIRLGAKYISALVFVDSTGQPWPISSYSIGDPNAFNIQSDGKGNTLLIQSATFYKQSNLAVILKGLNTPVMITLLAGQEAIDYKVELRVPGYGPNAVIRQNGIPNAVDPVLFNVLNAIPPKGSKELKVSGGDCQAWLLGDKLYLRTNLTIISPGFHSTMNSTDGTNAYRLQPAPVILALQNGRDKVLTLKLEGLE